MKFESLLVRSLSSFTVWSSEEVVNFPTPEGHLLDQDDSGVRIFRDMVGCYPTEARSKGIPIYCRDFTFMTPKLERI